MSAVKTIGQKQVSFVVQDEADATDLAIIERGLDDFGFQAAGEVRTGCYVFARSKDNILIGGLYAVKVDQGLYIKQLWVDEKYRGNGIAIRLMKDAETEASVKKCEEVWVDTLSYQAPGFYKKLGYQEVGRIIGYRAPHDCIFFKKDI